MSQSAIKSQNREADSDKETSEFKPLKTVISVNYKKSSALFTRFSGAFGNRPCMQMEQKIVTALYSGEQMFEGSN